MAGEALDIEHGRIRGESVEDPRVHAAARHGEPVCRDGSPGDAIAQRQGLPECGLDAARQPMVRMILTEDPTATQQMRETRARRAASS